MESRDGVLTPEPSAMDLPQDAAGTPSKKRRLSPGVPFVLASALASEGEPCSEFICPLCIETMEEPHITKCGHSFCYKCLCLSLEEDLSCPACRCGLDKEQSTFPNMSLNSIIKKFKVSPARFKPLKGSKIKPEDICLALGDCDLPAVNSLISLLNQRKEKLEVACKSNQLELLKMFLTELRSTKQVTLSRLNNELAILDHDLKSIESMMTSVCHDSTASSSHVVPTTPLCCPSDSSVQSFLFSSENLPDCGYPTSESALAGSLAAMSKPSRPTLSTEMKQRAFQHIEDLESSYFHLRQGPLLSGGLESFGRCIAKLVHYTGFKQLASLNYNNDLYNTSSIVSSVDFDKDCSHFAVAGVTKKIKVYDYSYVISNSAEIVYPVFEMSCTSKLSSLSFNKLHKQLLASSDYEGVVTVWDVQTATKTSVFQEHEKRCWSVDFCTTDPKLLASGSDDCKMKLWSINMRCSVMTVDSKANVCCVSFNPASRHEIAFGSADHGVHVYDVRNTRAAVAVLKGHRKAVSYAKFVSSTELVSASTDSQLKLWNVASSSCLRTYTGHANEKNFVGLDTNGDFVATGSENNSLHVYHKDVSKSLISQKFEVHRGGLESTRRDEESSDFVSAVCWRKGSDVVVAANSQGVIKVLEII